MITTRGEWAMLISFAGSPELYRSPGPVRATGEEPMSDDPDALQVLRQTGLSRN
ncbi:MAG: hypothetical protein ACXVKH_17230 [Candidatus Angelobacter sp.]